MEHSTGRVYNSYGDRKTGCVLMAEQDCLEVAGLVTLRPGDGRVHAKLFEGKAKRRQ